MQNKNKSLTPSKFQPLQLPVSPVASSPNKNLTGSARVIRDIVADIYNNIQSWNNFHIKGAQYVKQIALIKAESISEYSSELEDATNSLYNIVQGLKLCNDKFQVFKDQLSALLRIEKSCEPLFISLCVDDIVSIVETIVAGYSEEFKVKKLVLEHIAHSKNKDEVMFFAASWTLQPHITSQINLKVEALLVETGHRKPS